MIVFGRVGSLSSLPPSIVGEDLLTPFSANATALDSSCSCPPFTWTRVSQLMTHKSLFTSNFLPGILLWV